MGQWLHCGAKLILEQRGCGILSLVTSLAKISYVMDAWLAEFDPPEAIQIRLRDHKSMSADLLHCLSAFHSESFIGEFHRRESNEKIYLAPL